MKMIVACLMCLSLCTPILLMARSGEKKIKIALGYEVQQEREHESHDGGNEHLRAALQQDKLFPLPANFVHAAF